MHEDIEVIQHGGWKQNEKFKDFNDSLTTLPEEERERCTAKANMFFQRVMEKLEYYIQRWENELFKACLGSEKETAQRAAMYLVDQGQGQEQTNDHIMRIFHSAVHDRQIKLDPFSYFIARFCKMRDAVKQTQAFLLHSKAIELIAIGRDLWLEPANQELTAFRTFYLPLASNAHWSKILLKKQVLYRKLGLVKRCAPYLEFFDLPLLGQLQGNTKS